MCEASVVICIWGGQLEASRVSVLPVIQAHIICIVENSDRNMVVRTLRSGKHLSNSSATLTGADGWSLSLKVTLWEPHSIG